MAHDTTHDGMRRKAEQPALITYTSEGGGGGVVGETQHEERGGVLFRDVLPVERTVFDLAFIFSLSFSLRSHRKSRDS